ncbi:prolyl oligopeptidase family serine peptidase [Maribellus comscasis]|uniref:Prolyl oligopeptidase family serine peptidase n=1 Tax=Maribellus comscasis TaxID=2681766 RepID=A0A6I6K863_9BACT|nr:prolyl oligopeptidase family serine peptidase [Maribellus comscasis]QGY46234.1 prolyl oligopeptidase family serine peptidase [Maribellus comscasis]
MKKYSLILFVIMTQLSFAQNDSYLWLEDVENEKALNWVEEWNKKTLAVLTEHNSYKGIYNKNLEIYNSTDRIPEPTIFGNFIYNFWQDKEHERGIWRRTTIKSYLSKTPEWEIILDIDNLSGKDNIKWVFKGASGLYPDYNKFLISLSKGGGDAVVIKEFDVETKSFVENGFYVPEAKGNTSWIDKNTLMVSTDFGDGVTTSGYPRQVKIWKRGTELKDAKLVFEGEKDNMGVWGYTIPTQDKTYQLIMRYMTFYTAQYYVLEKGKLVKLELPDDIELAGIVNDMVILRLKSDWEVNDQFYKQGSVITAKYNDLLRGKPDFYLLVEPDERSSVAGLSSTKNMLLVNMLNNVKGELYTYKWDGSWRKHKINTPELGNISLAASDENSDNFFFYFENFLEPATLFYGDAATGDYNKVKSLPTFFPTEKYKVQQFETTSKDGTKIPYFVVGPKNMKPDSNNPTLLYAYGGFEVPELPSYSATTGTAWLEKGGVYVLANIRGGGEFGPKWHQAGLKANRQRVYDDFHAVAEDLVSRKITSPKKLGIFGGSNGGLLVGVAFTQRPDLYQAVVCAVPLLDMKRYNKLLAGASWMAEYGNPDIPEEWEYISKYSPYQNVKKGMNYPEVFFTTSTRDDRVHPGHARKMVAKMSDIGYKIYYFENTEGGHAAASTNEQRARMYALIFTYLQMKLMN